MQHLWELIPGSGVSAKLGENCQIPSRLTSGRPVIGGIEGYIRDFSSDYGPNPSSVLSEEWKDQAFYFFNKIFKNHFYV